tara:strand:- start:2201 stop:2542 length:342 start_codon:yes stop_codon:yes gene_type:complete
MNEKTNRYFLSGNASINFMKTSSSDLEKSSERWRVIAKDLEENMVPGQVCFVTGTEMKDDPDKTKVGRYKDRLYEALVAIRRENKIIEDIRTSYNFNLLCCWEGYHRLVVRKV